MKKGKIFFGIILIILSLVLTLGTFVAPFIGFGSLDIEAFGLSSAAAFVCFLLATPVFIAGVALVIIGALSGSKPALDNVKKEIDSAFTGENSFTNAFAPRKRYCEYCGKEMERNAKVCDSCGAGSKKK